MRGAALELRERASQGKGDDVSFMRGRKLPVTKNVGPQPSCRRGPAPAAVGPLRFWKLNLQGLLVASDASQAAAPHTNKSSTAAASTTAAMLTVVHLTLACSDFYMPSNGTNYRISVRTMDLGMDGGWNLSAVPRGLSRTQQFAPPVGAPLTWTSTYGYLGFASPKYGFPINDAVGEAINEAGLSCGALALVPSKMTAPSASKPNLHMAYLCQWAVEKYEKVSEVRAALESEVQL